MAGPSGTVTCLFTDIEGSTRLWQGDERDGALERVGATRLSSDAKALSLPPSNQGDGDGVIVFADKHVCPHHQ